MEVSHNWPSSSQPSLSCGCGSCSCCWLQLPLTTRCFPMQKHEVEHSHKPFTDSNCPESEQRNNIFKILTKQHSCPHRNQKNPNSIFLVLSVMPENPPEKNPILLFRIYCLNGWYEICESNVLAYPRGVCVCASLCLDFRTVSAFRFCAAIVVGILL